MNHLARTLCSSLLAASALFTSGVASASWINLADGDYDVTLTSCISGIPSVCSGFPLSGSITVSGSGLSFMNFTIDGVQFAGNPIDFITDPFINPGDIRERSRIQHPVPEFDFFELMSAVGPVLPAQVNQWIYCRDNPGADSCGLVASGEWVATRRAVPEPTTGLLLALGVMSLGLARLRQVRKPRHS